MSEARYTQRATIGDNEIDVQRHEVWAEDWVWNRFKFVMFIVGSILVLLAFWTHGFGVFEGQQTIKPVAPSVTVNVPPPTVVAPVVIQSPVPATPAKSPVQSAPKPTPASAIVKPSIPPVVEPALKPTEPPKLYW